MKNLAIIGIIGGFLIGCNPQKASKQNEMVMEQQEHIDSLRAVLDKQAVIDSMQQIIEENNQQTLIAAEEPVANAVPATATKTKKKWNNTAKGAVIGAGTGAVAGAVINKKRRGEGAVVGGIVGAGVGAATGLIIDDKKKKKN
tara:strand:+ start:181 stop:609 length:429 start_codon:yes stop_codon:yes gene_type:complete